MAPKTLAVRMNVAPLNALSPSSLSRARVLARASARRWTGLFPMVLALAVAGCSSGDHAPDDAGIDEDAEIDASLPDDDDDGRPNGIDNCKDVANPGQAD